MDTQLSKHFVEMLSTILISLLSLFSIWKIFFYIPKPILEIYSRPGRRGLLKQIFMYILLKWRKRQSNENKKDDVGLGLKRINDIKILESVKVGNVLISFFSFFSMN